MTAREFVFVSVQYKGAPQRTTQIVKKIETAALSLKMAAAEGFQLTPDGEFWVRDVTEEIVQREIGRFAASEGLEVEHARIVTEDEYREFAGANADFKDAFVDTGDGYAVDPERMRALSQDRLRAFRQSHLERLDVAFIRAVEDVIRKIDPENEKINAIVAEKQRLRDLPGFKDLFFATTPEQMREATINAIASAPAPPAADDGRIDA